MERPTLTQMIYEIPVGESQIFKGKCPQSIRRIAYRLQVDHGHKYMCRSIPDAYQVWRTA